MIVNLNLLHVRLSKGLSPNFDSTLSEFKGINQLLFPVKSLENLFSDYFKWDRVN